MTSFSTRGDPSNRQGLSREELARRYPPQKTLRLSANPFRFWKQAHCDHDWETWDHHSPASGLALSSKDVCRRCGAERS